MSILIAIAMISFSVLAIFLTAFFSQRKSRKEMDQLFSELLGSFQPQWERAHLISERVRTESERVKAEIDGLSESQHKLQGAIESIRSYARELHDRLPSSYYEKDDVRSMDLYRSNKTAKELKTLFEPKSRIRSGENSMVVNFPVALSPEQLSELFKTWLEKSTKEGALPESAVPFDPAKLHLLH